MSNNFAFTVGSRASDYVTIEVLGYDDAKADDKVRANWLRAAVVVSAGAWSGRLVQVAFTTREFMHFKEQVQALIKHGKGQASFEPMESYLILRLSADGTGRLEISGVAFDRPDGHNALAFNWGEDSALLKPLLERLKDIEHAFPVVK